MKLAATEIPRSRQEKLRHFLTETPVADFMAAMSGRHSAVVRSAPGNRLGPLVQALIEVFHSLWTPDAAFLGLRDPIAWESEVWTTDSL